MSVRAMSARAMSARGGASTTLARAVATRARVAVGAMISDVKQHRAGARLGLLFTILEMAVAMLVMAAIFSLIGRGAGFGNNVMVFMVTGFAPFLAFLRISSKAGTAFDVCAHHARSPLYTATGFALSQMLIAVVVTVLVVVLICSMLYAFGVDEAIPHDITYIGASLFFVTTLGLGIGLINASVGYFIKPWRPIYEVMTRGLFFLSGVFYVPDHLPLPIREVLQWNPLVHVIALFRLGFYETYPRVILDVAYLSWWALLAVFIGLWAERLSRRNVIV